MKTPRDFDGWEEWRDMVLDRLTELRETQKDIEKNVVDLRVEVGQLKVKAGAWGALAGLVPMVLEKIINR